jgi:hypothetical protein
MILPQADHCPYRQSTAQELGDGWQDYKYLQNIENICKKPGRNVLISKDGGNMNSTGKINDGLLMQLQV